MRTTTAFLILFSLQLFAGIGSSASAVSPLPVELISFTANLNGSNVELRWVTATEVNNFGFSVETCHDKSQLWETVGFIPGSGNSNSPKEYSFTDHLKLNLDHTLFYRLKQIDNNGKFEYSKVLEISTHIQLLTFKLQQNHPNPFNPSTIITYSIPASSYVIVEVYNVLGKLITTLVNKNQDPGSYKVSFDARGLSNGIYYYRIKAGTFTETKKMLLLK